MGKKRIFKGLNLISPGQSIRFLHECLGLIPDKERQSDELCDVVFVSIDTENGHGLVNGKRPLAGQIGVAILDTRELRGSNCPSDPISAYNFAVGKPEYCDKAYRNFLFGKSKAVQKAELLNELQSLIPSSRKIVFVAQGIATEIRFLRHIKFDLRNQIYGFLDTAMITEAVFPTMLPHRLVDLLKRFECPYQNLHTAGNDAYFTLRCLLMLAVTNYKEENVEEATRERLDQLATIGRSSIEQAKAESKKRRRERYKCGCSPPTVKSKNEAKKKLNDEEMAKKILRAARAEANRRARSEPTSSDTETTASCSLEGSWLLEMEE